jgi:hypothetical protein
MSDLESKLAPQESTPGTNARASLSALLKRWRAEDATGLDIDPRKPPQLCIVTGCRRETWKLIDAKNALYELIEADHV